MRSGAAGDVHNARCRSGEQHRKEGLGQSPRAEQVGLEHSARIRERGAADGFGPVDVRRGVVDEHVETTELLLDGSGRDIHAVIVGYVQANL